jgi:site-specific DNA-methyltransferase (adenine-specific)
MDDMVILGDNLDKAPLHIEKGTVDLIFTDPLWKTGKNWLASNDDGVVGYYEDNFPTLESYLDFLIRRVESWYELLKPSGHVVLHVDADFSDYIRVYVLDRVFGRMSYRNTIVWSYRRWPAKVKNKLNKFHQNLIWFTKVPIDECTLNEVRIPLENPRRVNLVDGKSRKALRDSEGNVIYKDQVDRPIGDVWDDIPPVANRGKDREDYPTQKPLGLAERAITMLTNENDLVLDPFMGSGTTLLAAHNLNRRFIGIDNEQTAFDKTINRLQKHDVAFKVINGVTINIKGIADLNHYEYQQLIVESLGGLVGPKSSDGGLDGIIHRSKTGIGVTRSKITRPTISKFVNDLDNFDLKYGIFVSPAGATREAVSECSKARLSGKADIVLKTEEDVLGSFTPEVFLRVEGLKVYAEVTGFKHKVVRYTWKINENEDQKYLFGSKKQKIVNKHDTVGMMDFNGIFNNGDIANIKCIATDSEGNSKAMSITHKF